MLTHCGNNVRNRYSGCVFSVKDIVPVPLKTSRNQAVMSTALSRALARSISKELFATVPRMTAPTCRGTPSSRVRWSSSRSIRRYGSSPGPRSGWPKVAAWFCRRSTPVHERRSHHPGRDSRQPRADRGRNGRDLRAHGLLTGDLRRLRSRQRHLRARDRRGDHAGPSQPAEFHLRDESHGPVGYRAHRGPRPG